MGALGGERHTQKGHDVIPRYPSVRNFAIAAGECAAVSHSQAGGVQKGIDLPRESGG